MRLGIDASNLRIGGGRTHLRHLVASRAALDAGFDSVVVWSDDETLGLLPDLPWVEKVSPPALRGSAARRALFQTVLLPRLARDVDVLLAPGGIAFGFRPRVVMSRNMLPFEPRERRRFGGRVRARLEFLRHLQAHSFSSADGLIFLTDYARRAVSAQLRASPKHVRVIPHGVDDDLRLAPRPQRAVESCSASDPFRLLYVSTVSAYKHQWVLAEVVAELRARGLPLELELVGPYDYLPSHRRLQHRIAELDPSGAFLHYRGSLPSSELREVYSRADAFLYASTCENLPNILLEAMANGLPIASTEVGPMREVLGDAALYFDVEQPRSVLTTIDQLVRSPELRAAHAARGYERARAYSWEACARATYAMLANVAVAHHAGGRRCAGS